MPNKYTAWIKQAKDAGYSDAELRDYLAKSKVPSSDIEEAFHTGNESTGNPMTDLIAGMGAGAAHSADDVYQLLRKIPGLADKLPPNAVQALFAPGTHYDPSNAGGGIDASTPDNAEAETGKVLEKLGEFFLPSGAVANATRGASFPVRAAAQGGVGGLLSAIQSHGDPASTAAGAGASVAGEGVASLLGMLGDALKDGAPGYYQKMLKFPNSVSIDDQEAASKLGLLHRLPAASKASLATIGDVKTPGTILGDLNKGVEDALNAPHNVVGQSGNQLASMNTILKPIYDEILASGQSGLQSSQDYRQALQDEIAPQLARWKKSPPTVNDAQALKKRLYTEIADSQYSDLNKSVTPATKAAKELLARGLKNSVNERIPEVAGLNDQMHNIIQLHDAITSAVKANPSKLDQMIKYGLGGLVGGSVITGHAMAPSTLIGVSGLALHKALTDPQAASRLAIVFHDNPQILRGLGEAGRNAIYQGANFLNGAGTPPAQ